MFVSYFYILAKEEIGVNKFGKLEKKCIGKYNREVCCFVRLYSFRYEKKDGGFYE